VETIERQTRGKKSRSFRRVSSEANWLRIRLIELMDGCRVTLVLLFPCFLIFHCYTLILSFTQSTQRSPLQQPHPSHAIHPTAMNGFYGAFIPQPAAYAQPPVLPYAPTRYPPYERGFNVDLWAYMGPRPPTRSLARDAPKPKVKAKAYQDWEWNLLVKVLAKCDTPDY
jgi:hypothetical protein